MSEATVADRRLHPATIGLRVLKNLPSTIIGLPAAFAFMADAGAARVIGVAVVALVVMAFATWLAWSRFRFGVGAHELVIESGVFSRTRRTIPFDRVHDVDIERGPLERLFGLAKVRVETGGAAKDEGLLDSLGLAEADALRAAVRAGKAGEIIAAEAEAQPALFAMSLRRVLVSGLFNFSLVWIAALFGLLQSFDDFLPFDLYDWGRWTGLAESRIEGRFTPGMIAAALLLAGMLGVVTGVARTLLRDFGFRLTAEAKGLRRERGLFTRTEAVIPKRRIQLAVVGAGLARRSLGWRSLSFQTLGAGAGESGRQDAAPLARPVEAAAVLTEVEGLRLPAAGALQRVSRRHVVKAIAEVAGLLPVILIAAIFLPAALLLLPAFPFALLWAVLERRSHRYALSDALLFVQRGYWDRRLWIVPVGSAQTVSVRRSWLQRRLGLATLLVDTAGAPAMGGVRIADLPEGVATQLADQLTPARLG